MALVAAGIMLGAAIAGPAASAAEMLAAQRSTQNIYVDGERVQMEAYSINGSNYVKLRDVGKLVGFNVTWNAESNSAMIDTGIPYEDDSVTTVRPIMTTAGTLAQTSGAVVTLPADGSKYVPQVGDRIPCDDGTLYEVTDVTRWENNVYSNEPLPELPKPACDWSLFPARTLPTPTTRHFSDEHGDDLFVLNLHETLRMRYTIYNALGSEPSAWRDNTPLATVEFGIPPEYEAYTAKFWPWDESNLTDLVHSRPNSRYYIAAWDYYHNGSYQYCRYCVLSL